MSGLNYNFVVQFFTVGLVQVAAKPGSSESLQQLIEIVKNPIVNVTASGAAAGMEDKIRQSKDKKVNKYIFGRKLPVYHCL